ncbi:MULTISPECIES: NAD(P)-dependent oxidoreductase [Streptomyces]|uniref:NAD(P)H-binding protein n=1 Tax=Streptomyces lycii TaxID=2654337 RepID=A0ABQ7FJ51_9ACTN|nr:MULTISPECIES: NAD(P)H-binding protein [Streptomyces]KAF4407826.1 NAD(P)H-binding protein [Streptomyces lycii]PGH48763.1 epimerase [Streptomyces sp. Ru87]
MKLTVLGATGGTGRHVVQQALDSGHQVTAVVRDPARLAVGDRPGLRTTTVPDLADAEALRPAFEGSDAVLSGVGVRSVKEARAGIAHTAARHILTALAGTGVSRFVAISAAPVGPTPAGESLPNRMIVRPLVGAVLRPVYTDLAAMEEEIRRSGTAWTVVRPPKLTDKPVTGVYRTAVGAIVPRGGTISRADLAHAMLAVLDDPATVGRTVGVAY